MKKLTLLTLLVSIYSTIATADSALIGRLSEFNSKGEIEQTNEECAVELKNVRKTHDTWDYITFDLILKSIGKKASRNTKVSVSYGVSSIGVLDGPMIFSSKDGSTKLIVEETSYEDLLRAKTRFIKVIHSKGTFTSGYFGGTGYKWKYKCEF